MKKTITTFLMMAVMAIMIPFATATTADAQTSKIKRVYKKHRNVMNVGIGAGAGALVGALMGGKKGALIGTAIGAGGGALYTYKINPKKKRYYRASRRY